jgi:hypothetical protein
MSRSSRRTPCTGMTLASSDKPFKTQEHRRERTAVRKVLRVTEDDAALPHPKAFGDPWKAPKDGKQWASGDIDHQHWLRK